MHLKLAYIQYTGKNYDLPLLDIWESAVNCERMAHKKALDKSKRDSNPGTEVCNNDWLWLLASFMDMHLLYG